MVPAPLHDRDGKIWMDGELVDWRDAKIHVLTHTLHYGMGVFEGVRAYETPAGTVNSSNVNFTLANAPSPATSLVLYRNGLKMAAGVDYTLSGNAVTFYVASTPQTGDQLNANYRYADPSNPLSSLAATQVVCSGVGSTTSSATIATSGTFR